MSTKRYSNGGDNGVDKVNPDVRVRLYISNVEQALESIKEKVHEDKVKRVVELVEAYLNDSKYFMEKGDIFTALATIAYAEGLLDALRWLNLLSFNWKSISELYERPRIVVAGSFEILHAGHIHLLKKAYELGRVYVILARDKNIEKFKKRKPIVPEEQREYVLSAIRYVFKVVKGDEEDLLKPIQEIKPDIILLGPDQWASEEWLFNELAKRGLKPQIIRLGEKVKCELCSTTSIACKILESFPREKCSNQ